MEPKESNQEHYNNPEGMWGMGYQKIPHGHTKTAQTHAEIPY